MNNIKVVIWGVDDYNTLGLFRELGPFGYDITFMVFLGVKNCATQSKYCQKYVETPTLEEGLQYLIDNFKDESEKVVIINSNDLIAEFLDKNREGLPHFFVVPGTSLPGSLTKLDDKYVMTEIAEELGFDVPQSRICRWDSVIDDIEYPCLLKPTHQTLGKYNEFKFKICKNKKSLKNTLKFVRKDSSFILQQYIPKESVALVYGCRTLDGRTTLAGILEKDRFCDNGDGSHGVLLSDFPSYISPDLITQFIEKVDFYGLFSVEFLVYKGKAYFIEVNWRNDGTSHLFFQAGANLPRLWVESCLKEVENITFTTRVKPRAFFMDEIFDEENIRKGIVTKEQWEKERSEATIYKYYDEEDVRPYEIVNSQKQKKLIMDSIVFKYRMYIVWFMDKIGLKRK